MKYFICIFLSISLLFLFCGEDKTLNLGDDAPPAVPSDVGLSKVGNGEITIYWSPNKEKDLAGYRVYRAENSSNPESFNMVADTTVTSYTDLGLNYNSVYYYSVSAYDVRDIESNRSDPISGKPLNTQAPSVPSNLKAVGHNITNPFIRLVWTPNVESDLGGYYIYRSENASFPISPSALIDSTSESVLIDENVEVNKMYYYRITAFDKGNWESLPTGIVGDVPLPAPTLSSPENNEVTSSTPTLKWENVPYAVKYKIFVMTSEVGGEIWNKQVNAGVTSVVYNGNTQLESGNTYYWKVGTITTDPDDINSVSETRSFVIR